MKALCIGGSLDGEWVIIPVMNSGQIVRLHENMGRAVGSEPKLLDYRVFILVDSPNEDEKIAIICLDGMPTEDVFRCLVDGYAKSLSDIEGSITSLAYEMACVLESVPLEDHGKEICKTLDMLEKLDPVRYKQNVRSKLWR